jgi:hypothetical protein
MQGGCKSFSYMRNDIDLIFCPYSRFRLVSLQVDELQDCQSQNDLEKQLEDLPENLDEVYERIVSGINKKHREDALKILQWLSFSARPLRLAEVAQVVGVVPDLDQSLCFKPSCVSPNPRSVLVICSSLVTETDGKFFGMNSPMPSQ